MITPVNYFAAQCVGYARSNSTTSSSLVATSKYLSLDYYLAQNPKLAMCRKTLLVKVPICGHPVEKQCCEPASGPAYPCTAICGEPLPCGHECERKCHTCTHRGQMGRYSGLTMVPAKRFVGDFTPRAVNHCEENCHSGSDCKLCPAPCEVRCAHSKVCKALLRAVCAMRREL